MKALIIAFSMYSKFPMPQVDWDSKNLSRALWFFPLVGLAIGAVLFGWLALASWLGLSALGAAGAVVLPIALSGGIHLDGFCDTCDALSSHQSRERKLEILKDSHTGAFGPFCCAMLLLVSYAAWRDVPLTWETMVALSLVPALSRAMSGLMAVTMPNARGSGLLATFTEPMDARRSKWVLIVWSIAVALAVCLLPCMAAHSLAPADITLWYAARLVGLVAFLGALLSLTWYRHMAMKEFGGITGDLAGCFLCVCECAAVVCVALVQHFIALI